MKRFERKRGLMRAPKLIWDVFCRGRYSFIYDQMAIRQESMSFAMRTNLLKAGMNMVYRRAVPWSMPLHIQAELTNYCNLRCPVCPTGSGILDRRPGVISTALFKALMEEIGPNLLTISLWAWGEPLLHPQLREILQIAGNYPAATFLSTNGQNLNDAETIRAILDFPPTYLIVAIDGLTDETNTKYRVGAKLERILSGVHRMKEERLRRNQRMPILHMRYMVMKHNQHEVDGVADFAKENGFDIVTFRELAPIAAPSADILLTELISDKDEYRGYVMEGNRRLRRDDFICQHPFWFPTVLCDGTLVACCEDYNSSEPLGVCSAGTSFREIWYGGDARKMRRAVRKDPDMVGFCRRCPERDRSSTDTSVKAVFLNDSMPPVTVRRG